MDDQTRELIRLKNQCKDLIDRCEKDIKSYAGLIKILNEKTSKRIASIKEAKEPLNSFNSIQLKSYNNGGRYGK